MIYRLSCLDKKLVDSWNYLLNFDFFLLITQVGFTLLGRMYMHAAGHVICTCHDILHILCDFLEELFTENTVM
jgi:hypothetical protein